MIRGLHDVTSMAGGGRHSALLKQSGHMVSLFRSKEILQKLSENQQALMSSFQEKVLPCWPVIQLRVVQS